MKSNADLQKDVYEELKWDPRINEGDIGVSVANGLVTLSGTIPNYAEKWAAEEAAQKVKGVSAVVNKIDVKLSNGNVKDDQHIAEAALNALHWNTWVPSESIKLTVEKGWITLAGSVKANYQKQAAENAVKELLGVRGITNEITVESSATVKDIQFHIKQALHRHAEQEAKGINIQVSNGEVVLSGKVRSWSEKSEAEWAALGTTGVRKVKNDLAVTYS